MIRKNPMHDTETPAGQARSEGEVARWMSAVYPPHPPVPIKTIGDYVKKVEEFEKPAPKKLTFEEWWENNVEPSPGEYKLIANYAWHAGQENNIGRIEAQVFNEQLKDENMRLISENKRLRALAKKIADMTEKLD
jgi:hypothetical protein